MSRFPRVAALLSSLVLATPTLAQGSFQIVSCNLGCSADATGQLGCSVVQVPPNAALTVEWSDDVDLATVTPLSLRIVDVQTGLTPPGTFFLKDARTVVFSAQSSFQSGATYQVFVAGVNQGDPGPHVSSQGGVPNADRLLCTIVATGPFSSVSSTCATAPNSAGAGAVLSSFGSSSLGLNDLEVTASGLPVGALTVPLAAATGAMLPFGDGVLCLQEPLVRLRPLVASDGSVSVDVDWTQLPPALAAAGASVHLQVLYRDPAFGLTGFNLSDALVADLVP